jgi:hypothetical protein
MPVMPGRRPRTYKEDVAMAREMGRRGPLGIVLPPRPLALSPSGSESSLDSAKVLSSDAVSTDGSDSTRSSEGSPTSQGSPKSFEFPKFNFCSVVTLGQSPKSVEFPKFRFGPKVAFGYLDLSAQPQVPGARYPPAKKVLPPLPPLPRDSVPDFGPFKAPVKPVEQLVLPGLKPALQFKLAPKGQTTLPRVLRTLDFTNRQVNPVFPEGETTFRPLVFTPSPVSPKKTILPPFPLLPGLFQGLAKTPHIPQNRPRPLRK